jgi:hypothetical protein
MPKPNKWPAYAQLVANPATIGDSIPRDVQVSHGGGSGGGKPPVDAETKNYLDANMRAVSAENNASFARLEAKIDGIQPGATWQQNAGVLATGIVVTLGLVFGILAFASDRFDSGANSMGAVEEALDLQRELNAEQDARIDKILGALEATND